MSRNSFQEHRRVKKIVSVAQACYP